MKETLNERELIVLFGVDIKYIYWENKRRVLKNRWKLRGNII